MTGNRCSSSRSRSSTRLGLRCARTTRTSLRESPATYTAARTAPDTALAGTPAALAAGASTLAGSALVDLEHDLVGAATPLRARLLERIIGACPRDDADWREFDRLIDLFGATLVAEGRDGAAFARVAMRDLVVAADHSAACAALRDLVGRRSEPHAVACVLNGASDRKDAPAFDCAVVTTPRRWPVNCNATQSADTRLAEFLRMYASGPRQTTIVTLVGAFDPEGARDRGEAKIQALVDQYMTRHRVDRLTLRTSSRGYVPPINTPGGSIASRPRSRRHTRERRDRLSRLSTRSDTPGSLAAQRRQSSKSCIAGSPWSPSARE